MRNKINCVKYYGMEGVISLSIKFNLLTSALRTLFKDFKKQNFMENCAFNASEIKVLNLF